MEIFEWVKEIEQIYKQLMENAKAENLKELEDLKLEEADKNESDLAERKRLLKTVLDGLKDEIGSEVAKFNDQIDISIKDIQHIFTNNKERIVEQIINQLGFGF